MIYLSLYEYLGKAAGNDLGREVASAAYQAGVKTQEREISNPKYTGKVHLYPKDFLEFYFREPESIQWKIYLEHLIELLMKMIYPFNYG
jgi:hypothetical protein